MSRQVSQGAKLAPSRESVHACCDDDAEVSEANAGRAENTEEVEPGPTRSQTNACHLGTYYRAQYAVCPVDSRPPGAQSEAFLITILSDFKCQVSSFNRISYVFFAQYPCVTAADSPGNVASDIISYEFTGTELLLHQQD